MVQLEGMHIQKIQKQHSSLVVVIPIAVRRALDLKSGDFIIFQSHSSGTVVEFQKFRPREAKHEYKQDDSDNAAASGSPRDQIKS